MKFLFLFFFFCLIWENNGSFGVGIFYYLIELDTSLMIFVEIIGLL